MEIIQISAVLPALAASELQILEGHNAAVTVNETAVITVFGSDYIDYCKFKSSLGKRVQLQFVCCSLNLFPDRTD